MLRHSTHRLITSQTSALSVPLVVVRHSSTTPHSKKSIESTRPLKQETNPLERSATQHPNSSSSKHETEGRSKPTTATATMAEKEAEAIRRFEERFGDSQQTQLGELDENGRPRGMAKQVSGNLFRLI